MCWSVHPSVPVHTEISPPRSDFLHLHLFHWSITRLPLLILKKNKKTSSSASLCECLLVFVNFICEKITIIVSLQKFFFSPYSFISLPQCCDQHDLRLTSDALPDAIRIQTQTSHVVSASSTAKPPGKLPALLWKQCKYRNPSAFV